MQYVWLAIIGVSLAAVALAAFLANPFVFMLLGPEEWRARVERLRPYRFWIGFAILVCAVATAVYVARYG